MAKLDNKAEHRGLKLDKWDIENIGNALAIYEVLNPPGKVKTMEHEGVEYIEYCNIGDHLHYMRENKVKDQVGFKHLKRKSFDVPIRLRLSIPPSLEQWLNKAYPTLFTDEVQTKQFLRAFPRFDLEK